MIGQSRWLAVTAMFVALAYVSALASYFIPNVSLIFIAVFSAGALFGLKSGLIVGLLGEFLWTFLNPVGPAPPPTMLGQIVGMTAVGALGATVFNRKLMRQPSPFGYWSLFHLGLTCGLAFQIILTSFEMAAYGLTWEYLTLGLTFSILTIVSNGIIFPFCYPFLVRLNNRAGAHV